MSTVLPETWTSPVGVEHEPLSAADEARYGRNQLALIWLRFLRSSASDRDLILAGAASVAVAIAFAKVFSPQYLLWLAPLVVVIPGRRRAALAGLFRCVCPDCLGLSDALARTALPSLGSASRRTRA